MLRPCQGFDVRLARRRPAARLLGDWRWGVLQVISLGLASQDDDIADMAHVDGFLTAALLFYSFRPAGVRLFERVSKDVPAEQVTMT